MAVLPSQLAMVLLVKNEIDIIELNIRFHARMGVSQFLVMDNGSTDGTLECLKTLQKEFKIIIVENPTGVYQQSKWMTELIRQAKTAFGATHVIPNDADEFWVPTGFNSLPEQTFADSSMQSIHRYNRVLTKELIATEGNYWSSPYIVESPIMYSGETQKFKPNISMQLVKISPKVIVKPKGLIKIKGGNHRARHWQFWTKANNPNITVHHFPIRSWQQFLTNIKNRQNILDKPNVKMGPHYRRWVKQLYENVLTNEFEQLTPTQQQVNALLEIGVLEQEDRLPLILAECAKECQHLRN